MRPSTLLALGLVSLSPAATLFVLEGASSANQYSSIGAALAAASNGDTVAIKNRKGNLPWNENLLVSKNLVLTRVDGAEDWQLNGYINVKNTPKAVIVDLVQTGTIADTLSQVDSVFWINSSLTGLRGSTAPSSGSYVGLFSSNVLDSVNLSPSSQIYSAQLVNSQITGNVSMVNGQVLGSLISGNLTFASGGRPEIVKIMGSEIKGSVSLNGSSLIYQVRNNKIMGSSGLTVSGAANDNHIFAHNEIVRTLQLGPGNSQVYHNYVQTISGNTSVEAFYNSGALTKYVNANGTVLGSIRYITNETGCFEETINYCTVSSTATINSNYDGYCGGMILTAKKWCLSSQPNSTTGYVYRYYAGNGYYGTSGYMMDKSIYVMPDTLKISFGPTEASLPILTGSLKLNFKNLANLSQGNPDPIYNNIDGSIASLGVAGGPTPYSNWSRAGRLSPSLTQARVYDLTLPSSVKTGEQIPVTIKAYDH